MDLLERACKMRWNTLHLLFIAFMCYLCFTPQIKETYSKTTEIKAEL